MQIKWELRTQKHQSTFQKDNYENFKKQVTVYSVIPYHNDYVLYPLMKILINGHTIRQ